MKQILTLLSISCGLVLLFGQPVVELTDFQRENQAYHLPGSFTLNTTAAWHLAEDSKDQPLEFFIIDNGLYNRHPNIPYDKGVDFFQIKRDRTDIYPPRLSVDINRFSDFAMTLPTLQLDEYFFHGDEMLEKLFGNHSSHVFLGVLPEENTLFSFCNEAERPLYFEYTLPYVSNTGCFSTLSTIKLFPDIILFFNNFTIMPNDSSEEVKNKYLNKLETTRAIVEEQINNKTLLFTVPEVTDGCIYRESGHFVGNIYEGIDPHFFRTGRTNNVGTPNDDYSEEREIDFLSASNFARTKGKDANGEYEYTDPSDVTECPSVTLASGVAGMLLREAKRSGKFTSSDIKGIMKTTANKTNSSSSDDVFINEKLKFTVRRFLNNRTDAVGHGNINAHQALLLMKALAGQEEHVFTSEAVDAGTPIEFSFNEVLLSNEKSHAFAISGYNDLNTYKLPAKDANGKINFQANNGNNGYHLRAIQIKRTSNAELTDKDMLSKIVVTPNSDKIEFHDYNDGETLITTIKIPSLVSLLNGEASK